MTYKEFIELVGYDKESDNLSISCQWLVAGARGGDCWGSEAEDYTESELESEPESWELTELLNKFYPDIDFMQYAEITSLIIHDSQSYSEYYGNWTRYDLKRINLRELYNALCEIISEML